MDRCDALLEVEQAYDEAEKKAREAADAWAHLKRVVRRVHEQSGIPQAELARHLRKHRNTIAGWCAR